MMASWNTNHHHPSHSPVQQQQQHDQEGEENKHGHKDEHDGDTKDTKQQEEDEWTVATQEFFRSMSDKFGSFKQRMSESVKSAILGARQYDALSILTSELLPMLEREAGDNSRWDILASLRQLLQRNDKFSPDEAILSGKPLSGERYELLQRVQNLHHFGHFAVAAYGWRGALMSRLFRSTLQKHEWTRFKSVAGNAMGKEETFFTKLTGIQTEDILYECKHQPTYGVPKHWLVVDHSKQALVLAIRGTTTAADALTDVVSRNKTFIGDTKAHEGIAVSAEGLYASLFSSEGLYLQKWLKKFKGYDFVTCGHSLGGGVAILLCGLIHHFRTLHVNALGEEQAQEVPFYGVNVYCYAYGPPPVIWPASNFPPDATRNTFVFINGEDCVPRLSLRSVRDLVKLLRLLCESSTPEQSTEGITSMVEHFPRVLTPSVLNEPGYLSTSSDKGDHFNSSLIAQNDEAEEDVDKYPLEIPGRLLYMKLSLPLPVSMDNEEQLMEMTTNAQASSSGYRQVFSEYWEHHQETINHTFESVSSWFKSISKGMSREGADNIPVENTSESHSQSSHGRHEYSETNSDASARASDDSVPTRGDRISSLRLSKGTEGLSLGRDVSKFLSDRSHFKFAWLSEPSSADFPEIIVRTCSIQEHMPFSYLGVLLELEHIIQKACSL